MNSRGLIAGFLIAAAALATGTDARASDIQSSEFRNEAPALMTEFNENTKPSPTLREYSHSDNERKGALVAEAIRTLINDYRSDYDRSGQIKTSARLAGNLNTANFIESLFLRGTESQKTRNLAALMEVIESRSVTKPDETLEKTILTYVSFRLQQQPTVANNSPR